MASRKFLVPANLLNLTEDPASGESGDIYFNTTSDKLKIYDGTAWVEVGGGSGSTITVSDTAPASPTTGDAWYDNTTGSFYVYDGTFWVEVNGLIENPLPSEIDGNDTTLKVKRNTQANWASTNPILSAGEVGYESDTGLTKTGDGTSTWNSISYTSTSTTTYFVQNNTGSTIPRGTLVSAVGAETTGRIDVAPFEVSGTQDSELRVMGITMTDISTGNKGTVMSFGTLRNIDTRGSVSSALAVGDETWSVGDILFAHPTADGKLTKVRPQHDLAVAFVTKSDATTGQIAVRIDAGNNHLEWMHDVLINGVSEDDVLRYDESSGLWKNTHPNIITAKNAEESTVSAFTPVYINSETLGLSQVTFLKADANITSKMPATGITTSSVASEAFSKILTHGVVSGMTLTGYSDGDLLYVANGGGFTKTRPTGDDYIQPFGRVLSVDNGSIYVFGNTFVSSIDSLPNLASDKIWLGTSGRPVETTLNTTVVTEGTNLYFTDERAQDAAAELFTSGVHTGASVEYNDSTGKVNITNTGVTSITGTTNEIAVSGSTGGVTISIPDSPVFVTPDIGVATATSINGTTIPTSETLVVSGDLSDYAPIVDPVFTNNVEVDGVLKFDVVDGIAKGLIRVLSGPGYNQFQVYTPEQLSLYSEGYAGLYSSDNVIISGTNGEYLNSVSGNNQIATIGDLSSFITSETDPVFTASEAYYITSTDTSNWNAAYGWGDHASAGYLTSESDTLQTVTDRDATSSNVITISNTTQATDSTSGALIISGGMGVAKDVWIDGNLHVNGTTITENTQTVATHDNMIYLNAAQDSTITNAVGDGTYVTYTADNDYTPGMDIRVTGMDPSGYNISSADGLTIYSATSTQFVVAKTTTGTFVSGGTAHAKEEANPDLGFAGGYYDAGYAHAGLFRDASDGVFKFFKGYTPEPDEAVNIDTGHASFALADISAAGASFEGTVTMIYPDILSSSSGNTKLGTNAFGYTTATNSIAIGNYGPGIDSSGNLNIFIGASSGTAVTGSLNIALGADAGYGNVSGDNNLLLGNSSGGGIGSGSYNVILGSNNGYEIANSSYNIIISDGEGSIRAKWIYNDNGWTLGNIFSAIWNGTEIGYAYGGTGLTTLGTAGQVLQVNSTEDAIEWATPSGGGGGGGLTTTTTSLIQSTAQTIATVPIPSGEEIVSAECLVLLSSTSDGTYYTSKCLIVGGTIVGDPMANITEYGIIGDMDANLSVAKVGSNIELKAQVTSYTNVTAKVVYFAISADNGAA